MAILTDLDYLIRRELLLALHDRSVEHISADEVVISAVFRITSRVRTPVFRMCLSVRTR